MPSQRLLWPLACLFLLVLRTGAQTPVEASTSRIGTDVYAFGRDFTIGAREVEPVLVERYGLRQNGRELLKILVSSRVIEALAKEAGIVALDAEVRGAWDRLDTDIRLAGESGGLVGQLAAKHMSAEEFFDYLRLSLLHEKLTRRALELAEDAPVTPEQQEVWLRQVKAERGETLLTPPWSEGVIARCGEIEISLSEFGAILSKRLPEQDLRETAWHLLLLRSIQARMPDVSPAALQGEIAAEIERRRRKHERANPAIPFDRMLAAQGRTIDMLARDPSVHVAVLTRLWIDRKEGPDGLRKTYEREREFFEGRFGLAVRTHLMFLTAGRFKNKLNRLTFEMAEAELLKMVGTVGNTDDFAVLCGKFSDEPKTQEKNGELGFVSRADPRWPEPIRRAIFEKIGQRGVNLPTEGLPVGPLRLDTGCALLWLSAVRPSPPWEVMGEYVHEELRRRLLQEFVTEPEVVLARDPEPRPGSEDR